MHEMAEGHEIQKASEEPRMNHSAHSAKPSKIHEKHRGRHEGHNISDFKKRFLISLILTIPIILLSPFIQSIVGYQLQFPGSIYVLFLLSTLIYFYGGNPFLKGFFDEIKDNNIGMMTLIAVAISAAKNYIRKIELLEQFISKCETRQIQFYDKSEIGRIAKRVGVDRDSVRASLRRKGYKLTMNAHGIPAWMKS